jgi:hypothetical protein
MSDPTRSGGSSGGARPAGEEPRADAVVSTDAALDAEEAMLRAEIHAIARALPERIDVDPSKVEQGLARLVLTLIEMLRKVLEHQAVRRMDGGTLTEAEVERLGLALAQLDGRMQELKAIFGLSDEDLEIDLGPLGRVR